MGPDFGSGPARSRRPTSHAAAATNPEPATDAATGTAAATTAIPLLGSGTAMHSLHLGGSTPGFTAIKDMRNRQDAAAASCQSVTRR